jgi:hypothetical protein
MHKYLQGGCESDSDHDVDLLKKGGKLKSVSEFVLVEFVSGIKMRYRERFSRISRITGDPAFA